VGGANNCTTCENPTLADSAVLIAYTSDNKLIIYRFNGPVVHPKNFKRLCTGGGQSTAMFSVKYSLQLVADSFKNCTVLYSNSSSIQRAVWRNYKMYFCHDIWKVSKALFSPFFYRDVQLQCLR